MILPPFLEVKRRPGGTREVFSCRLLSRREDGVVLLYVLSSSWEVSGVRLASGTRTVAYFWPTHAYNVYYWLTVDAQPVGCYFNIARDTVLHPHHVEWTDLGLDLLVRPGGQATWIDEEEAAGLGAEDREAAAAGRRHLEAVYR
ncbi:MAG: DUF402 domain-containing protein, partial [Armatimonadetes bacterium]|nr:DUF402 domain-containing protein [Armatimonadota bacterium]